MYSNYIIKFVDLKRMSEKRQIAPKKKSLTTSFFDIGKKDVQSKCTIVKKKIFVIIFN